MSSPIRQAQPPLKFIPPTLNPTIVRGVQWLLPLYLRSRTALRHIDTENVATLVDLYQQFQAGKIRLLLAFRHPSADDPLCLAHLLWKAVPKVAKRQGIKLNQPIHSHFMYDRGIPLWAGERMGWLYSQLGGTPIHRGKIDLIGLRSARDLFVNGQYPLAAAPEGATNGHSEVISPLEPGISQLAFWGEEDIRKAGRSEQVLILPIGIKYHYISPPWSAVEQLLTGLESDTGLAPADPTTAIGNETELYERLYRLGGHVLVKMEEFYTRFYHQTLPNATSALPTSHEQLMTRLNALLDVALQVAEDYFGLQNKKGSFIDRCRRLEQAGWDYIYRDDLKPEKISLLDRGLADRVAEEADLRVWHMRIVESFVAVTGNYVREKPSAERFAETALLMWDMIARIKGGSPFNRPKLGNQAAVVTIGQPLSVSDRWESYQGGRRNAKQAVADLTQALQTELEKLI
ncbi:1-acyl-sn-glycerol-3-phosphate acyltransferase [Pantanalinema rosaneae CENA516]|uniref:1-acyl-sn-glycerol-3-phosphate acyltransferase n=1 Tax=Pantanalinema rosaneae TaxID=1620701 RepID=UPI003D702395